MNVKINPGLMRVRVLFGSKMKHDAGTECCLSLCQAVSFLPAAEEDEEMMMRKDECQGRGKLRHRQRRMMIFTRPLVSVGLK